MNTRAISTRRSRGRSACSDKIVFSNRRFYVVILVTGIWMVGCGTPTRIESGGSIQTSEAQGSPSVVTEITPAELAQRTADTYREAASLEYDARVTQSNYPAEIECKVKHGLEQRVQLEVYENGELIYELTKAPTPDGIRVVEKNHRGSEQADYVVASEEIASGRWDTRCKRDISGCLFGAHQNSWVGAGSRQASFFQEIISTAESVDIVRFDDRTCYRLETTRLPDVDETLWVDAETFAVLRWKYIVRGVERDRIYSHVIIRPSECAVDHRARRVAEFLWE